MHTDQTILRGGTQVLVRSPAGFRGGQFRQASVFHGYVKCDTSPNDIAVRIVTPEIERDGAEYVMVPMAHIFRA